MSSDRTAARREYDAFVAQIRGNEPIDRQAEAAKFTSLLAEVLGRRVPVLMVGAHAEGTGVMLLASDLAELIERARRHAV